jgi:SWI/SNF-related matrix-associated actin-dependent regulator of chromatin subfamily A3
MEPQWNPMVENQALDRVHRLGQTKPVKTFRYIAKGTFDQVLKPKIARCMYRE